MKIDGVETIPLSVPLDKPAQFATRTVKEREFSIARVFTNEDVVGIGCVPIGEPFSVTSIIERKLKNLVIGEDPFATEIIWDKMYREMYRDRKGAAIRAISAVDIALWDIKGKALNMPLYKLLGGNQKKVPCYASGGYYKEGKGIEGLVKEMMSYVNRGFKAVKMKVGAVSLDQDIERVKAVRENIGEDITLLIDANNAYNTHEAIKAGRAFEKYDAYWFEEPVGPEDFLGSRKVAEKLDIPVASGELEYTIYGFMNLVENRAVDIIQPDATVVGGITEWMKIAGLARAYGIPVAPHWEQEVHMHLTSATPNAMWVEFFMKEIDVRKEAELYKDYVEPVNGYLEIPDKPGLGVELDEKAVEKYRIDR